jgi:hypothetical protein
MYLLTYDYEDASRDEYFVEGEEAIANARYKEIINDPYVPFDSINVLTMCVGISFSNRPDAKIYTYRTEQYLGNLKVVKLRNKDGYVKIDEYGDPISVYIRTAGYRPAAEVKALAKKLGRTNLGVLYVDDLFVQKRVI